MLSGWLVSSVRRLKRFSRFTPLLALLFCLTGMLLLKTKLTLALVRFWCFLVHSIHKGTSETTLLGKVVSARMRGGGGGRSIGPGTQRKIEMASRLVPSLQGEGTTSRQLEL